MKKINIIGGGPAGLMAAQQLSQKYEIHLYEKGKALGRKFLVAGKGGFNLTNSSVGATLRNKYLPKKRLDQVLTFFDSNATRDWLLDLGIPTFVGTSGRVFPEKGIKPIHVLQKWLARLDQQNVHWHLEHRFVGFNDQGIPIVQHDNQQILLKGEATIFALGGASWSVTGSQGDWLSHFSEIGIPTLPFQPSNCGLVIDWPETIKKPHAGKPLKNCQYTHDNQTQTGEVIITEYGLEGNGIYPLIPSIRKQLHSSNTTDVFLDLKPYNTVKELLQKLGEKSPKNYAKALNIKSNELALIKAFTDKETFLKPRKLARAIKALPIPVIGLRPIEEAISTVGGICWEALNEDFSLKKFPTIYVIGEMIDWDAPTGGYLLQGCFSMGAAIQMR